MRVAFAGTAAVSVPFLRALIECSDHEVALVITKPDAARGRGRTIQPCEVAQLASEENIPCLKLETLRKENTVKVAQSLISAQVDAVVVVSYGLIIPADLLNVIKHGWINVHYSLLPAWRGASPVQSALAAGETESGISIFKITTGLDTGPVFTQAKVNMGDSADAATVLDQLNETALPALLSTLKQLECNTAILIEQSNLPPAKPGQELAPRLTKNDSFIDFQCNAALVKGKIRGFNPAPGAWTRRANGQILGIRGAEIAESLSGLNPGEVRVAKHDLWVGTTSCAIRITEVKPPGKPWMKAEDWARGARLEESERWGCNE